MRRAPHGVALLLTLLTVTGVSIALARVAQAEPVSSGNVTAELASEQRTIRPGGMFTLGLSLRPAEGWHTYWQNSGDSGLPTRIEWTLPPGFHAGELMWPHPVRLGDPPFVTYGYERDALLLTNLDAPSTLQPGSDVEIVAAARWLACRADACVPGKADLKVHLRVDSGAPQIDPGWQAAFAKARSELPKMAVDWSASVRETADQVHVDVIAPAQARPVATAVQVFAIDPGVIDASAPPSVRATDSGFTIDVARDERREPLPELLQLVVVADAAADAPAPFRALRINAHKAVESPPAGAAKAPSQGAVAAKAPDKRTAQSSRAAHAGGITFWAAIVLALAGGLILNLMPCVFPVLSLKILGFVHIAHHDRPSVRRHGYAFAAGVLASFWILAAVLIVLRMAGDSLGWGFQLQQPLFVALLAALLLAMALNLFGVFELGSSVPGAAGRLDSASGYHGSFLSGVLATVLATPCSAPFMGTAIGYALVQPPLKTFLVFTALGAGMALPYLVLACVPMLLRRLPKPGAWMERFREAMAFPLLATVAWLVWVFGQQTGNDGVLGLLIALLLGSLGLWIGGRFAGGAHRRLVAVLTGLCVVASIAMMFSVASPRVASRFEEASATTAAGRQAPSDIRRDDGTLRWQPWDPDAIVQHRTEGRVVFVDFTADWCLSCKVNERVALSGDEFARRMTDAKAVAMKADWTSSDPRITRALADFGRSGVPLYVVYPRDPSRAPIVLPQILTPAIVLEAIEKAVA